MEEEKSQLNSERKNFSGQKGGIKSPVLKNSASSQFEVVKREKSRFHAESLRRKSFDALDGAEGPSIEQNRGSGGV